MRLIGLLSLIIVVVSSSCAAFESTDCLESDFDYGMNSFYFDKEWLIEKDGQSIVRIGINVESFKPETPKEIKAFDKMVKPVDGSTINIESMYKNSNKDQIIVFDLPVENNIIKLNLDVTTKLTKGYGKYAGLILTKFTLKQNVYFYNPVMGQWFGFTESHNHVNDSVDIAGKSCYAEKSLGQLFRSILYQERDWDSPVILGHITPMEDFTRIFPSKTYNKHLAKVDEWINDYKDSNSKHPLLWWKQVD